MKRVMYKMGDELLDEAPKEEPTLVTMKQLLEILSKSFRDLNIVIDLSDYVTREEYDAKIQELETRLEELNSRFSL